MRSDAPYDPFSPASDPERYVPRDATESALADLERVVVERRTPVALRGAPGIGRTTLLRRLAARLADRYEAVYLGYAALAPEDLARWVLGSLRRDPGSDPEQTLLAEAFRLRRSGSGLLVLVDDAEAFSAEAAAAIRRWSLDSAGALRPVVCFVEGRTTEGAIASLGDDVHVVRLAAPMSFDESRAFLTGHLGPEPPERVRHLFDDETVARLHDASGGVPRLLHSAAQGHLWRKVLEPQLLGDAARADRIAREVDRARREADQRRREQAEAARLAEQEAHERAREEARRRVQEETRRNAVEQAARREAEAVARREAEERRRAQAEAEARRHAEAERQRAEAEARRREQEEARQRAEAEARRQAEEEEAWRAEEQARQQAEAEARQRAEEEAQRQAEAAARRQAEEEAARREAEAEAERRAAEETRQRAEAEARRQADEEARLQAEAAERERVEREAREAEEAARAREAAAEREAEEARRRAFEEARRRTEEQSRRRREEEARRQAEEAARRASEAADAERTQAALRTLARAEEAAARQAQEDAHFARAAAAQQAAAEPATPRRPLRTLAPPPRARSIVGVAALLVLAAVALPLLRSQLVADAPLAQPVPAATNAETIPAPPTAPLADDRAGDVATVEPIPEAPAEPGITEPAPLAPAPPPEPIPVHINAIPWATIHVDGEAVGETPLAGVPLEPGSHDFEARFPDGRVVQRTIDIAEGMRHVVFD